MLLPLGAPPGNSRIPMGTGSVGPGAPRLEAEVPRGPGPPAVAAPGRWAHCPPRVRAAPAAPRLLCAPAPAVPERLRGVRRDPGAAAHPAPAGPRLSAGSRRPGLGGLLGCRRRPGTRRAREPRHPRERRQLRALSRHLAGGLCPARERRSQAGALLPPSHRPVVHGAPEPAPAAPALRTWGLGRAPPSLSRASSGHSAPGSVVRLIPINHSISLASSPPSKTIGKTTWKDRNLIPYPQKPCSECQINSIS